MPRFASPLAAMIAKKSTRGFIVFGSGSSGNEQTPNSVTPPEAKTTSLAESANGHVKVHRVYWKIDDTMALGAPGPSPQSNVVAVLASAGEVGVCCLAFPIRSVHKRV